MNSMKSSQFISLFKFNINCKSVKDFVNIKSINENNFCLS